MSEEQSEPTVIESTEVVASATEPEITTETANESSEAVASSNAEASVAEKVDGDKEMANGDANDGEQKDDAPEQPNGDAGGEAATKEDPPAAEPVEEVSVEQTEKTEQTIEAVVESSAPATETVVEDAVPATEMVVEDTVAKDDNKEIEQAKEATPLTRKRSRSAIDDSEIKRPKLASGSLDEPDASFIICRERSGFGDDSASKWFCAESKTVRCTCFLF